MHNVPDDVEQVVAAALAEDVGDGDVTAALVPEDAVATARVIARESAVICGRAWFDEVFRQLDSGMGVDWRDLKEGDSVRPDQVLCVLEGTARTMLTGERTALNFLQTLSGVATTTHRYVDRVKGTKVRILDTRKTLPGLRSAQKYAVRCGGGYNHRFGLYDGILIKENHIAAAGSIASAVKAARQQSARHSVQVEVENLNQVEEAIAAGADALLLDNFETHILARAVNMVRLKRHPKGQPILLEASGNIDLNNIRDVADTKVDYVSIGGLTKNVTAVDLSMRFVGQDDGDRQEPITI